MSTKKVYCYSVRIPDNYKFEDILIDADFKKPVSIGIKKVEMYAVHRDVARKIVTGLFVCTQIKDIPPTHLPGGDDYSAVQLKKGEGLAYPNAFLYCEQTKSLLIEYNKFGVTANNLIEFFGINAVNKNFLDWQMGLEIILTPNAYDRVKNMVKIKEVKIQVATPTMMMKQNRKFTGNLASIINLSKSLNAERSICLTLKGNYEDGGISKKETLELMNGVDSLGKKNPDAAWNLVNNFEVTGQYATDEGIKEELINLFVDRLSTTFILEDKMIHASLQPVARKEGMAESYKYLSPLLVQIVGIKK